MKRKLFFIIPAAVIGAVILFAVLFILFLTIVEYRPKPVENIPFTSGTKMLLRGKPYSLMNWNIGYAGLGKDEDFFTFKKYTTVTFIMAKGWERESLIAYFDENDEFVKIE